MKVFELEDTQLILVLNHFTKKEQEVIYKYNKLIGNEINKNKSTYEKGKEAMNRLRK